MFDLFKPYPHLLMGFSEGQDGPMKVKVPDKIFLKNRQNYFATKNILLSQVVTAYLVHGTIVKKVDQINGGELIPACDGLMTQTDDLYLSITAADCLPVYVFDPKTQAIALAHVGWRGAADNIIRNLVRLMCQDFGTEAADLLIGIGPGIQACHFEIQSDVQKAFVNFPQALQERSAQMFVDLPCVITQQLLAEGALLSHIESCGECTYCLSGTYFSFRRDKPAEAQAMVAFIGKQKY